MRNYESIGEGFQRSLLLRNRLSRLRLGDKALVA